MLMMGATLAAKPALSVNASAVTQREDIAKLNATMVQVLADPMVRKRFDELGIEIAPLAQQSPEALRALQKAESERWWPIIKASNIKAE